MPKRLSLFLLGAWHAAAGDEALTAFKYDKVRALLAYLAVEAARAHRREALMGLLWPELSEGAARNNLRQVLLTLREAIGDREAQPPFILSSRVAIQLNPDADWWVDMAAFVQLVEACERHAHRRPESCRACAVRLEEAITLYRGPFLAEFFLPDNLRFEEWALVKREWLSQLALQALARLAAYHERRGQYEEGVAYARRQLELDPWREGAHRQLMRLLALNGERTAALVQYEQCRELLQRELGVEPEPETMALYEQIRTALDDAPVSPERLALPAAHPHMLPPSTTPFVGRDDELAQIGGLLDESACRLLTLTGPGGIGKTRLALQAATEQLDAYADGVYFIPLVALPPDVPLADYITDHVGLAMEEAGDSRQQLLDWLGNRELLLVLDNAELLLGRQPDGDVTLLGDILRHAPEVNVLVTSREALRLQGEWRFVVSGLALPDAPAPGEEVEAFDAVQFFVQSARRANPQLLLSAAEEDAVVQICRQVAGHPLAIELAAGWTGTLSCTEIAQELARNPGFLVSTQQDVPARHRSMRAVFEQSYRLLSDEEQSVLRRLSLFPAGFRLQGARAVAADTVEVLASLGQKSLLQRTISGRHELHDVVHYFAAEKLWAAEEVDARRRYIQYYLDLASEAEGHLRAAGQEKWLALLREEHSNLLAALDWAFDAGNLESAGRLASRVWRFWRLQGHLHQGRAWVERILEADATAARGALSAHTKAVLLEAGGILAWLQGDYDPAESLTRQSLSLYETLDERKGMASAYHHLGTLALHRGQYEEALQQLEASLALRREVSDMWGLCVCLNNLGAAAGRHGDYARAQMYYEEGLALSRELGVPSVVATLLSNLGDNAEVQGRHTYARSLFEESLDLRRELGDKIGIAYSLARLGDNALVRGDVNEAYHYQSQSLRLLCELGDKEHIVYCLESIAAIAASGPSARRAARLWGATEALREQIGVPLPPSRAEEYAPYINSGRERVGQAVWAAQWTEGRRLSLDEALAAGRTLCAGRTRMD